MKKYLLATHGHFASGLTHTIKMFTGELENFYSIDGYVDEQDFTEQIQTFCNEISNEDQGIIFTDIFGGSVNQKAVSIIKNHSRKNIFLISGVNLPVVLEILLSNEPVSEELLKVSIKRCPVELVSLADNETDLLTNVSDFFD